MSFKKYDYILQGSEATEENAYDATNCLVWSEVEVLEIENMFPHSRYIDTINGIEIFYNYGADYYFFCEEEHN